MDGIIGVILLIGSYMADCPSAIAVSADGRMAYAVNEFGDSRQGVSSYRVLPLSGGASAGVTRCGGITAVNARLEKTGFTQELGPGGTVQGPCNILLLGNRIISSNYTDGSVSIIGLNDDGSLGRLIRHIPLACGEHPSGRPSRGHCAVPSPDGKYLFVTDLGYDTVHRISLSSLETDNFDIVWENKSEQWYGPRHIVFSRDGRYAYMICERSDKLICFKYLDGVLEPVQELPAYHGNGHASSGIQISPDGCFLYTSHRNDQDGIGIFKIDKESGRLTPAGYCKTGLHPRQFMISPDGRSLYVACKDSNCVEIYSRDIATGQLAKESSFRTESPTFVLLYKE